MTEIFLTNCPAIPGLTFRHFRGEMDFPGMVAIIHASSDIDGVETTVSVEGMLQAFQNLRNCDPYQDILLAEVNGEIIGYERGWWLEDLDGGYLYRFNGFLAPEWRRKRIGSAMLAWMEARLRVIAADHPPEEPKFFRPQGLDYRETGTIAMLLEAGYQPIRYYHNMVRPSLENIPDSPLPEGLEVRPTLPEQYREIWDSIHQGNGEDEWGNTKVTEEDYQRWMAHPHFQPKLWQIAWDIETDKPVAHILTFIDHQENERYNRKRGYTEGIGVNRAWRRKRVARALISLSLKAQKAAGMMESALVADSDSISNVTSFYESCGFHTIYTDAIYQKPF